MRRETWTEEKLALLATYVDNGFSQEHMNFMLGINDAELEDGLSRLAGKSSKHGA